MTDPRHDPQFIQAAQNMGAWAIMDAVLEAGLCVGEGR